MQHLEVSGAVRHIYIYMSLGGEGLIPYRVASIIAKFHPCQLYSDADKSLARPTFRCISFDGENISFDASLVIYINSTNIPPIMIITRVYEHQNLLSL